MDSLTNDRGFLQDFNELHGGNTFVDFLLFSDGLCTEWEIHLHNIEAERHNRMADRKRRAGLCPAHN